MNKEIIARMSIYMNQVNAAKISVKPTLLTTDDRAQKGVLTFISLTVGPSVASRYKNLLFTSPKILKGIKSTLPAEVKKIWRTALKIEKEKKVWIARMTRLSKSDILNSAKEWVGVGLALQVQEIALPAGWRKELKEEMEVLVNDAYKPNIQGVIKADKTRQELIDTLKYSAKLLVVTIPRQPKTPAAIKPKQPIGDKPSINLNKYKSYDTAYLTPTLWTKFNTKLKALEKKYGMVRVHLDVQDASNFGPKFKAYRAYYEKPGIKQGRDFKNDIRWKLWNSFPNPLSKRWK